MLRFVTMYIIVKVLEPSDFCQLDIIYSIKVSVCHASLAFPITLQKIEANYRVNEFMTCNRTCSSALTLLAL